MYNHVKYRPFISSPCWRFVKKAAHATRWQAHPHQGGPGRGVEGRSPLPQPAGVESLAFMRTNVHTDLMFGGGRTPAHPSPPHEAKNVKNPESDHDQEQDHDQEKPSPCGVLGPKARNSVWGNSLLPGRGNRLERLPLLERCSRPHRCWIIRPQYLAPIRRGRFTEAPFPLPSPGSGSLSPGRSGRAERARGHPRRIFGEAMKSVPY